jgi:hypothetical protein
MRIKILMFKEHLRIEAEELNLKNHQLLRRELLLLPAHRLSVKARRTEAAEIVEAAVAAAEVEIPGIQVQAAAAIQEGDN